MFAGIFFFLFLLLHERYVRFEINPTCASFGFTAFKSSFSSPYLKLRLEKKPALFSYRVLLLVMRPTLNN